MVMKYLNSIKNSIKNSFKFQGRSSVAEYWGMVTLWIIISIIGNYIFTSLGENYLGNAKIIGSISLLFQTVITFPLYGLGVRRLHDVNRSGWWIWISLTIIGIIPLIYWTLKNSDKEVNKFGAMPTDINSGNFHRNLGVSLNLILLILIGISVYANFNNFSEWQKEDIKEADFEAQIIYRYFSAKENSKSLIKTSFSCTKEKQMGLIIEISSVSNKIELPIEIIQSDQPVYITIDNKEKKSEILKLNFSVLKDKKNIAHVNINRNDFLELAKSDFEVSIKTIDGLFSAKINSNDSDTINFINNCI